MKLHDVFTRIEHRTSEYEKSPFFGFLRDPNIDLRRKLAFVPGVAHFVLTFSDLCRYVLPVEPTTDKWQEVVNVHSAEDAGHWEWFLEDITALAYDTPHDYSGALRVVWHESSVRTRLLSYQLCHYALSATAIQKLVLIECMEAAFKPTIVNIRAVADDLSRVSGIPLRFLGSSHTAAEEAHTMDNPEAQSAIRDIEVDEKTHADLLRMVDQTFFRFSAFALDMLDLAQSSRM